MGPRVVVRGWLGRWGAGLSAALLKAAIAAAGLGLIPGKAQAQTAAPMDGFINGVASTQGLQGSHWRTDVWLHNARQDYPIIFRLFYAPKEKPADENNFVPITVNPNQTVYLDDVVKNTFGKTGSGAIYFQILPGFSDKTKFLVIESNTYNKTPDGKQFGQQVPGRFWINPYKEWGDPEKYIGDLGTSQFLPGPINNQRYRANLNFLTDSQCEKARITIRTNNGFPLVEQIVNLTPNTWYQWADIVKKFGLQNRLDGLYIEFTPIEGGYAFSSTSIIDNKTNDGSNFEGTNRWNIESDAFLLAAAYLKGANNSQWRSDVFTINAKPDGTTGVTFFAMPRGQDNRGNLDPRGRDYYPGQAIIFPNILKELFEYLPGTSATLWLNQLRGTAQRDVVAFMRTYSEEQNDQGETVTYGQAVRPVNWKDSLRNDLEGRIVGVIHNNNFRTNLILQNTLSSNQVRTNEPISPIIQVYDMQGNKVGEKTYNLLPGEYRQVNKVIEDILGTGATIEHATLVIKLPNIDPRWRGGVIAAASVINGNTNPGTNDPRLIIAQPVDRSDPYGDAVRAFVDWFLGDGTSRIHLSNDEYRAMIRGTPLTRSYNRDFADVLYDYADPPLPFAKESLLIGNMEDTDCDLKNGEMWRAYDPAQLSPVPRIFTQYIDPDGRVIYFHLTSAGVTALQSLIRTFLIDYVGKYPEKYGFDPTRPPASNPDPTWNVGNPNPDPCQ